MVHTVSRPSCPTTVSDPSEPPNFEVICLETEPHKVGREGLDRVVIWKPHAESDWFVATTHPLNFQAFQEVDKFFMRFTPEMELLGTLP